MKKFGPLPGLRGTFILALRHPSQWLRVNEPLRLPRPRNRSRHRRCFPRRHYRRYLCCRYPHCRFRRWDSSWFHSRDYYCRWFHFPCCRLSRSPSFRSGSSYSFHSGSRYLDCLDWHCSHFQSNLFPFARGPSAGCPSAPGFRFRLFRRFGIHCLACFRRCLFPAAPVHPSLRHRLPRQPGPSPLHQTLHTLLQIP